MFSAGNRFRTRVATLTVIGMLAAFLQSSTAPGAMAGQSPAPAPVGGPARPQPPDEASAPTAYRPVERPESELHKKLAGQKPDFGDDDPLSKAWKHGEISVDEYARYSVERLTRPQKVPKRLRAQEGVPHEAGLALHYALSLAERQASPETKAWLKDAFESPGPITRRPSVSPESATPSAAWNECGDAFLYLEQYFSCVHTENTTIKFEIYYNVDGLTSEDGVQAVDGNGNDIPDAIDAITFNLVKAWEQYESWGYDITGQGVQVAVGFDFGGVNPNHPGITIPTGGPGSDTGGPVILLPPDPGDPFPSTPGTRQHWRYTYLPYHEMFHAVQYHYLSTAHLGANLTSINWWMEATAEWATHEMYKKINPFGPKPDAYAQNLALFLRKPEQALNVAFSPWSPSPKRQYGAFILANYLTEATAFDFVRQTWQVMEDKLPLEAIDQVLTGYGRNLKNELEGFTVANYRLGAKTTNLTAFLGAADGYSDPHAPSVWRDQLSPDNRPARAVETALAWGGSAEGLVPAIQPGGSSYLEFTPPASGNGQLNITVTGSNRHSPPDFRYLLVTWSGLSARTPLQWSRATMSESTGSASIALNSGEVATLIIARVDTVAASAGPGNDANDESVNWSASLVTEPGPQINTALTTMFKTYGENAKCADWSGGDAAQSLPLPDGKRAWFFADTFLGDPAKRSTGNETSYIRNSVVIQDGSALRTITGGSTCRETDPSTDFWSRYAKTPAGEGGQYWTGDSKIFGNEIIKFYYEGIGDENTRGAYARFSADDLETQSVVNATPSSLQDCSARAPYPIIWGASLLDHDGYTYVYGWEADGSQAEKPLYLARAPGSTPSGLVDQTRWRYYAGAGSGGSAQWVESCSASKPLLPKSEVDFSVVHINGLFWLVRHTPASQAPGKIIATPSRTAWGFGSEMVDLYTPPETTTNPQYSTIYGARIHPVIFPNGRRVAISYTVGTSAMNSSCRIRGYFFPDAYRTQFIDVPTSAFFSSKIP